MKRGKKKTPSRLPVPVWFRRGRERLSRRTADQPGGGDEVGTDHYPQISLLSQSQPPTQQIPQSEQFGRLGETTYSNQVTPLGSDVSLVSDGSSVHVPVIAFNPWSIFSPRSGRETEGVQSAPTSPGRSAVQPPRLTRAGTDPLLRPSQSDLRSPFLGVSPAPSLSWDKFDLHSSLSTGLDTPHTLLPPASQEGTEFVFPPPAINERQLEVSHSEESENTNGQ